MRRLMDFITRVLFGGDTKPTFQKSIYPNEEDQLLKQARDRVERLQEEMRADDLPHPHHQRHRP